MGISLSDTAREELVRVMSKLGRQDWGVRVGVKGGGCSGLSYTMDFAQEPADHDKISEVDGIRVFVDPKSYLYLNGMTLDYGTELMGGGFRFVNPNATRTCSCGESFSV